MSQLQVVIERQPIPGAQASSDDKVFPSTLFRNLLSRNLSGLTYNLYFGRARKLLCSKGS